MRLGCSFAGKYPLSPHIVSSENAIGEYSSKSVMNEVLYTACITEVDLVNSRKFQCKTAIQFYIDFALGASLFCIKH